MTTPDQADSGNSNDELNEFFQGETLEGQKFGTFSGVFRPTILTILGVMMYLREGWLVGNAGLLGAIAIILVCYLITGTTALSLSSITTNIRVGSGGVFSIISQSLGLEVGGSVGIPLYLAQSLSAALYIQGMVETWLYMFPTHPRLSVMLIFLVVLFSLSYLSVKLAFRAQTIAMLALILALGSILSGWYSHPIQTNPVLWGDFEGGSLAMLFAVFFPAATGIMVGSSLSGNLKAARRNIPVGTLAAWSVSLLIYITLAIWYATIANPQDMMNTGKILAVEKAFFGPVVLVGIMASCFSAALSSLVAGPRVLSALSSFQIIPFHKVFSTLHRGEPRNATLFTGILVLAALLLGDLNAIAKLLTMFFLVIYFMINLVLFIEQRLKMISFRPVFHISSWVPVVGTLSSLIAILIINPITGLVAISFVLAIYIYLDYKHLNTPWETVHSGIFVSIANWAAKKVFLGEYSHFKRSWKPDLLVPVERSTQLEGYFRPILALTYPQGSVQVAGFYQNEMDEDRKVTKALIKDFQRENLFATSSMIESREFISGLRTCISVMKGSIFCPNTIFTSIENRTQDELSEIVQMAKRNSLGVVFMAWHPESRLGRERQVNLWIRDQYPDWRLGLKLANLDYAVLMSYQLKKNWNARIRTICVVKEEAHKDMARNFIIKLLKYARMPRDFEVLVEAGDIGEYLKKAPMADINIMGLSEQVEKKTLEDIVCKTGTSCLFVLDSGQESALA
jgi:amino acid transporter